MCGSTNLMKQDGVFVCQSCGTKYSVEEAKKMMIDGIVNVNVSNEHSLDYAKSLYESERYSDALEEVQKFLKQNADNLEAMELEADITQKFDVFGAVPLEMRVIKKISNNNIIERRVSSLVDSIMSVHNRTLTSYEKWYSANQYAREFLNDIISKSYSTIFSFDIIYTTLKQIQYEGILYKTIGENLCKVYKINSSPRWDCTPSSEFASIRENLAWGIEAQETMKAIFSKYESQYPVPEPNIVGKVGTGCYIATSVYGSYDCPQVWTLRRYRDNNLAQTFLGRVFIHTYYATSPTLVRWFGKMPWFNSFWKRHLDRMVSKLKAAGVSDSPYQDHKW